MSGADRIGAVAVDDDFDPEAAQQVEPRRAHRRRDTDAARTSELDQQVTDVTCESRVLLQSAYLLAMSESVTLTAVFTPDENGWTMTQLAEWPAVVTCGRTVEEARQMLLDAAHEMIASYRDEGRDPPIGGGHAEQVTIDLAAARGDRISSVIDRSRLREAARGRESQHLDQRCARPPRAASAAS